ncbi:MAG: Sialic acid-specific 9-O-acetylesterase [Planctomycetaceae bacterium]|nr:Sialic acid-specific 9-O-acetylesterase [Planctomycetaceae bacterium]
MKLAMAGAAMVLGLMICPPVVSANVTLAPLFGHGMVLQRDLPVRIWGTASNGEQITVHFCGQRVSVVADKQGRWECALQPLKAGGPFSLRIDAGNQLALDDVYVGEVWACAGQSNMNTPLHDQVPNNQEIVRQADRPLLRIYRHAQPEAGWVKSSPKVASDFPSVAYCFGRDLQIAVNVPVGLIHFPENGSNLESWLSPETRERVTQHNPNHRSGLYPRLAAVLHYSLRGLVWYQGESNGDTLQRARSYRDLLSGFVQDCRRISNQPELPIILIQIAPYGKPQDEPGDSPLAEVREAQRRVSQETPGVGLVVTTDLGEQNDIHPHNKEPVGVRAALIARAKVYGERIAASGPTIRRAIVSGRQLALEFDHATGGLQTGREDLHGFELASSDRRFVKATAQFDGTRILVNIPDGLMPKYVRFGWSDFPLIDLRNAAQLPTSSFEVSISAE